jgi:hypothetical protein
MGVTVTVLDDYLYIVGGGVAVHLADDKEDAESRVAGCMLPFAIATSAEQTLTTPYSECHSCSLAER